MTTATINSAQTFPRRKDRTLWRVTKGALVPFDGLTISQLRAKGYKNGDLLQAELTKARNPKFHRLAHQLGSLLAENLEAFDGIDSHTVLKRLQVESGVGCDEMAINAPGLGMLMHRIPRSLSFASMDEGEFKAVISGMCRHVSKTYWKTCTPEQIEAMASAWVEAT